MASAPPYVLGIGGTTRPGSSTEKALRYALALCEKRGATTTMFAGPDLVALPHYAPESPERTDEAKRLIAEYRRADGIIVASAAYHGTVSGLVKNALDYTEDLREDERVYLSGMPFGCISTGAGWQGVITTLQALRAIAHTLRAWATPLGVGINSLEQKFNADGEPADEKARFQLEVLAKDVMDFLEWRRAVR